MAATRPDIDLEKAHIKSFRVQTSATVTKFMPVKLGTLYTDILDATSGSTAIGIALKSGVAGDYVSVALLTSQCPLPCKVGTAGATLDGFLEIGTTGAIDRTLGGGTTVRHIVAKALETGVSGDIIAVMPACFDGVSA